MYKLKATIAVLSAVGLLCFSAGCGDETQQSNQAGPPAEIAYGWCGFMDWNEALDDAERECCDCVEGAGDEDELAGCNGICLESEN